MVAAFTVVHHSLYYLHHAGMYFRVRIYVHFMHIRPKQPHKTNTTPPTWHAPFEIESKRRIQQQCRNGRASLWWCRIRNENEWSRRSRNRHTRPLKERARSSTEGDGYTHTNEQHDRRGEPIKTKLGSTKCRPYGRLSRPHIRYVCESVVCALTQSWRNERTNESDGTDEGALPNNTRTETRRNICVNLFTTNTNANVSQLCIVSSSWCRCLILLHAARLAVYLHKPIDPITNETTRWIHRSRSFVGWHSHTHTRAKRYNGVPFRNFKNIHSFFSAASSSSSASCLGFQRAVICYIYIYIHFIRYTENCFDHATA